MGKQYEKCNSLGLFLCGNLSMLKLVGDLGVNLLSVTVLGQLRLAAYSFSIEVGRRRR